MNRMTLLILFVVGQIWAQNNTPVITNLNTLVDNQNGLVTISYDLWDDEDDEMSVALKISNDDGLTYLFAGDSVSGDVGYPITSGNDKQILWYYQTDLTRTFRAKIVADDFYEIDIADLVAEVDSLNLFNDLTQIEGVRHRTSGIAKLEETKALISSRFAEYNLQESRHEFMYGAYEAVNLIGRKSGQADEEIVYIVDGHFDTVIGSPGADDNGSAVVGMLEAIRVLSAYNFNHTIKFIGFDLEEPWPPGLIGSSRFVSEALLPYEQIEGVFNFEMIGYASDEPGSQTFPEGFELLFPDMVDSSAAYDHRGDFLFNFANENSNFLKNEFDNHAALYVPEFRVLSGSVTGNGEIAPDLRRSDHAPFWDAGYQALFITNGGNFRNPNYHTANDTVGSLDFNFMSNVVKATVATVADLAGIMHCGVSESESFELSVHINIVHVPADSSTIQSAINGAWGGDTILVAAGTYVENINFNGKDVVVRSVEGREVTIIDGNQNGSTVLMIGGETEAAVLDGFTITNGNGTFHNGNIYGGGIIVSDNSSPILKNLIISGNSIPDDEMNGGGGISITYNSHPTLSDIIITDNQSGFAGGGLSMGFNSNPVIESVTIHGNSSVLYGGGVMLFDHCAPLFNNVTVANNSCDTEAGGVQMSHANTPVFINSVFWGNSSWQIAQGGVTAYLPDTTHIAYSNVQDGADDIWQGVGRVNWLEGNLSLDPLFSEPLAGDFTLLETSPCIDAGTEFYVLNGDTLVNLSADDYHGVAPDMGAWEYVPAVATSNANQLPIAYSLAQNYPNPFNPSTTINYELPVQSEVSIVIYDILGQEVATLVSEVQTTGCKSIIWNGTNKSGNQVSAGMYLYKIQAGHFSQTRKMLLLK